MRKSISMTKTEPATEIASHVVDLSIVIPVYNELENLDPLQGEIDQAMQSLGLAYEVIYVNDGSSDGSADKLAQTVSNNEDGLNSFRTLVFVDLRRNFGQTAAISAGIDQACGDVIVLMDADLQNDPADIGTLMAHLNDGYDVVSGWRKNRKDKFLTRRLPSMTANWLISQVTGVHLHDYGCTLKAYRREVVNEIRLYGEMHRLIPVFAAAAGAKIGEVVVNHRPRLHGRSKYGLMRTLKVLLDLLTVKFLLSYRTTPMYLFGGVGSAMIAVSVLIVLLALVNKWLRHISLIQTPLPQLAATFFGLGIQSILLGLTTEVLMRTYYESQEKPIYVVRRIVRTRQSSDDVNALLDPFA